MENLFYFGIVIYSLFALITLINDEKLYQISEYLKKNPKEELPPKIIILIIFYFTMFLLMIVGLLSSQWIIFLFLLIKTVLFYPFIKFGYVRRISTLIEMAGCLFILLNKFHLHLNLYQILLQWINN